MSDLAQLFQYAPATAGAFLGESQAIKQQEEKLKQQELMQTIQKIQMEMQQNQELHPLKVQQQQAQNANLAAQLGGYQADSANKKLSTEYASATNPSAIGAAIAEAEARKRKASAPGNPQEALLQVAALFGGQEPSPGANAAAFREVLLNNGFKEDSPVFQNIMGQISNVGPGGMSQFFTDLAQRAVATNPKAIADREKYAANNNARYLIQGLKNAGATEVARIKAAAMRASAEAKNKAVDLATALQSGKITLEKALVATKAAVATAETEEEQAMWIMMHDNLQQEIENKDVRRSFGQPNTPGIPRTALPPRPAAPQRPASAAAAPQNPVPASGTVNGGKNKFTIEKTN